LIDDDAAAEIDDLSRQVQAAAKAKDEQTRLLRDLQSRLSSSDEGVRLLAVGQVARAEKRLAELTAECDDLVHRQSELLHIAMFG
jgi:predicted translin family RNA/ssDNA-binding protein